MDGDSTDQLILPQHRDHEKRTRATRICECDERRKTLNTGLFIPYVGDVYGLPRSRQTAKRNLRPRTYDRCKAPLFSMGDRHAMQCHRPEAVAVPEKHDAHACLAEARGVLEHGLE